MAIRLSSLLYIATVCDMRSAYGCAEVRIVNPKSYSDSTVARMAWQCDAPQARAGCASWYAGRVTVESHSPESFKLAGRIIAELDAIGSAGAFDWRHAPHHACTALESLEVRRGLYDVCASEYRPVDAVCLAPFSRWCDDYTRTGGNGGNCNHNVTARDLPEAQALMLKAFAERASTGVGVSDNHEARMLAWITAGKPCIRIETGPESIPALGDMFCQTMKAEA